MTVSQIQNVALGLLLIYVPLSSISILISQLLINSIQAKSKTLERCLRIIFGDKTNDLLELPQIKSLRPIRFRNILSVFGAVLEPKKVEKIPAPILVDAFFELMNLSQKSNKNARKLKKNINNMPESESKKVLQNWIEQGVSTLDELRAKTLIYFSGLLFQAEETAFFYTRSFVIIISIGIVILFGVDSLQLAKYFAMSEDVQTIALLKVGAVLNEKGSDTDMAVLMKEYKALPARIGWWEKESIPVNATLGDWVMYVLLKIIGLSLSAAAVSTGTTVSFDLLNKEKEASLGSILV